MTTNVDLGGNTLIVEALKVGATTPGQAGTDISSTELIYLDGVTAGTVTASKAVVVDSSKQLNELRVVQTTTSTTPSSTQSYAVQATETASATGITSGNIRAGRFATTVSGTITGGAYAMGVQGKLTVSGTMNHADSRLAAGFFQLDTTGGTFTTGQLSALWVDHGAGSTGAKGGQFNMVRISDTVAGSKGNAIIYAHANATNVLDLSAPGGTMDWFAASGTSANSAGKSDGCAAQKVLIISVGGVPYYIPAFDQNT